MSTHVSILALIGVISCSLAVAVHADQDLVLQNPAVPVAAQNESTVEDLGPTESLLEFADHCCNLVCTDFGCHCTPCVRLPEGGCPDGWLQVPSCFGDGSSDQEWDDLSLDSAAWLADADPEAATPDAAGWFGPAPADAGNQFETDRVATTNLVFTVRLENAAEPVTIELVGNVPPPAIPGDERSDDVEDSAPDASSLARLLRAVALAAGDLADQDADRPPAFLVDLSKANGEESQDRPQLIALERVVVPDDRVPHLNAESLDSFGQEPDLPLNPRPCHYECHCDNSPPFPYCVCWLVCP
jgi:hypothetical protein